MRLGSNNRETVTRRTFYTAELFSARTYECYRLLNIITERDTSQNIDQTSFSNISDSVAGPCK